MATLVGNEGREMSMGTNLKSGVIILVFVVGMVSIAAGRTIYVDYDGSADFNNIQAAINDSNDGDTIIVADGTYTGFGNRDIDFLGKAITLRSENGPQNCIIDCNGTQAEPHRGFYFHNGEDANSVLEGFTITNGLANDLIVPFGGAIYGNGTKATIQNNYIVNNVAFTSSFPTVARGGGLYDCNGTIQYNIISGNSAVAGDMESYSSGGGLYGCYGTIKHNIISNNSAEFGGGMEIYLSNPIVSGCAFTGNIAYYYGGGVYNIRGNPKVTNCTFNGNVAMVGAGMYNRTGGSPILKNCTFSGNEATLAGGIYNRSDSDPNLINCILWGNMPDQIIDYDYPISNTTVLFSDVQGGWQGLGNIDADPCFADPCNDDYHLKSQAGRWDANSESWVLDDVTSPCIDAGNPGCPLDDEPAPNGNRRNMGAYGGTAEASKSPVNWRSIADLTNDWVVDSNDLKVFIDYWLNTGECIPGDLNRNQSTNSADFALLANNWLRTSHGESVFYFGVATKGPLHIASNIEPEHGNISIESDVYIVSENSNLALEMIGNTHITGDVFIVNPFGTVDLQGGDASIGGETVPGAYDHVFTGIDPVEFPVPNPSYFEHYVVEDINLTETTFENIRIPPNTNPSFGGGVTMNGVVFIETPNLVTFTGHVSITGIIVGDGDVTDNSGTNRIDFLGTVDSSPVTSLPAQFGGLREETGTFLMAPGFSVSFSGDFETINGAIAANGITFSGNAGGTIEGSVLNYSDTKMELRGNSDLFFNRWADIEIPAGFE
jgi:hypothetical protein